MEILDVHQSLLSPAALLNVLATEYDVGTPAQCLLCLAGVTDTYLVTTERARYIFRLYRAGQRTDDDIAYELDALHHLAQSGLAVSVPVARKDGSWFRSLQAPEGPRQGAQSTYAQGREAYREEEYSAPFGRSVAEMHNATGDFHSPHRRFHLDFRILLDRPLESMRPFLTHRSDDWAYMLDVATAGLGWGFCHGDTLGSNARLEGDTVVHFDFDDGGPGWRAYDLATYCWICGLLQAPARWEEFLRAYRERRPVGDVDLAAVPLFVALREVWLVG